MWVKHRAKWIVLCVVVLACLFSGAIHLNNPAAQTAVTNSLPQLVYNLSPQRRTHILYGDATGGGHKAGQGKPGKTEFPANWDDERIIAVITRIANDANLPMRQSGKRYWLRTGEEDGLQIRVVLDKEHGEIITGYPLSGHRVQ